MLKLCSLAASLVLSLGACVDEDIGTPPPPTGDEDEQIGNDVDPLPDPGNTPCASLDSKGDNPCAPD